MDKAQRRQPGIRHDREPGTAARDKPGTKPDDAKAAAAAEDAALLFRVTDKDGGDIGHDTATSGGVLTITADCDFAVLTGTLDGLGARQGVEKLCFVTAGAESTFAIADMLDKGASGDVFRLMHDGGSVSFTLGADGIDMRYTGISMIEMCRRAGVCTFLQNYLIEIPAAVR